MKTEFIKIRDELRIGLIVVGIVLGLALNMMSGPGLLFSLLGMAAGFGMFLLPYMLCGMSAGDVKLNMAAGSLAGPYFIVGASIWTGIIGAAYVVAKALYKRTAGDLFRFTGQYSGYLMGKVFTRDMSREELTGPHIPYAPFIAAGCLIQSVLLKGGIM